jgi:putative CocE/NonD family hydrolase
MSVFVERGIRVEMRDGTRLATDMYLPEAPAHGQRWPVILVRTPYDRLAADRQSESVWFADHGYAVVVQDCRGRFQSEGVFRLGRGEAEDGYDAVEWAAAQPWSNGRVGTMGTSYLAWVQSALATLAPPHLRAMWVHEGIANALKESVRQGGAFELRWMGWAFYGAATDPRLDVETRRHLSRVDLRDWLSWALPKPGRSPLALSPTYETWYWEYLTGGVAGDLWEARGPNVERYYEEHADVPTVYSGGWYDSYTRATIRNFQGLSPLKQSPQFLFMGPWTHGSQEPLHTYAGDVDLGPEAAVDFLGLQCRFFDRWLKEEKRGTGFGPRVRYFLMGGGSGRRRTDGRLDHGGAWRTADTWPPPRSRGLRYHLDASDALTGAAPQSAGSRAIVHDPDCPVPTIGGNLSFLKYIWPVPEHMEDMPVLARLTQVSPVGGQNQVTFPGLFGACAPYGPLLARSDVMAFWTEPLEQPVELSGPVSVTLFVSTDGPDTDFTAKLVDWYPPSADYPDGYALNITDGIQRLRFRDGCDAERMVRPGEVVQVRIELYPSANLFQRGHRIRLDIAGSNFPRFDLNSNSGEPVGQATTARRAVNRVHWGPNQPSCVDLTVMSAGD